MGAEALASCLFPVWDFMEVSFGRETTTRQQRVDVWLWHHVKLSLFFSFPFPPYPSVSEVIFDFDVTYLHSFYLFCLIARSCTYFDAFIISFYLAFLLFHFTFRLLVSFAIIFSPFQNSKRSFSDVYQSNEKRFRRHMISPSHSSLALLPIA